MPQHRPRRLRHDRRSGTVARPGSELDDARDAVPRHRAVRAVDRADAEREARRSRCRCAGRRRRDLGEPAPAAARGRSRALRRAARAPAALPLAVAAGGHRRGAPRVRTAACRCRTGLRRLPDRFPARAGAQQLRDDHEPHAGHRARRATVRTRSSSIASTPGSRSSRKWPRRSACSRGRWCRGNAMTEFLLAAAGFVLAMVALGLVRVLRGPGDADRMMAAQLLGSGGIAALLAGRRGDRRRLGRRRVADARAARGVRVDRVREVRAAVVARTTPDDEERT